MIRFIIRVFQIVHLFLQYRLYRWLPYGMICVPLHLIFPWTLWPLNQKTAPKRCCAALQKMGPLFVKVGQLCSTRADIFTPQWLNAFAQLQDQVPIQPSAPFEALFINVLPESLRQRLDVQWQKPLAAASLAQVYPATLDRQTAVVLKMRRPQLIAQIESDLRALGFLIPILSAITPARLRLKELYAQLRITLLHESDFRYESLHASKLRSKTQPWAHCPEFYEEFTRPEILLSQALSHGDRLQIFLESGGMSQRQKAARDLLRLVTYTLFRDGFFHADLHPGNIFLHAPTGRLSLIDFGQVGELTEADHFYLCQQIAALLRKDFRSIALLFEEAGWAPSHGFDKSSFQKDLELIIQPLWDAALDSIDISQVLAQLITLSRRYQLRLQPGFLLAQKVIMMAEGLARQLDPSIVPLEIFQKDILLAIKERYGPMSWQSHAQQQRWRFERWALGIKPSVPPQAQREGSLIVALLWVSLGWALFLLLSQYMPDSSMSPIMFLVFWHCAAVLFGPYLLRRDV